MTISMTQAKARKAFGAEVLNQLYHDLTNAYHEVPESTSRNYDIFDPKTGKQKSTTTRQVGVHGHDYGRITYHTRKMNPSPPKDGETVTFKAGGTPYTVYNTKAHIRILAERLGLELCKSEYRKMPVWDGCNGYPVGENPEEFSTVKVKPLDIFPPDSLYLPVWVDREKRPANVFIEVFGRLLWMGKTHNEPTITLEDVINAVLMHSRIEGAASPELIASCQYARELLNEEIQP